MSKIVRTYLYDRKTGKPMIGVNGTAFRSDTGANAGTAVSDANGLLQVVVSAESVNHYLMAFVPGDIRVMDERVNHIRSSQPVYNVMDDYGAVGDGIADDRTAWNNAISACEAGGVVYAPPPPVRYKVVPVDVGGGAYQGIIGKSNISILSEGAEISIPQASYKQTGLYFGTVSRVRIKGIKVKATGMTNARYTGSGRPLTGSTTSNVFAFEFLECADVKFADVEAENCDIGIRVTGNSAGSNHDWDIRGFTATNTHMPIMASYLDDVTAVNLNLTRPAAGTTSYYDHHVYLYGARRHTYTGVLIENGISESPTSGSYSFDMTGDSTHTIENVHFVNVVAKNIGSLIDTTDHCYDVTCSVVSIDGLGASGENSVIWQHQPGALAGGNVGIYDCKVRGAVGTGGLIATNADNGSHVDVRFVELEDRTSDRFAQLGGGDHLVTIAGCTFLDCNNTAQPWISNAASATTVGDATGTCNTAGTTVTWVSGTKFTGLTGTITINAVAYTIASITDATHLELTASAGTQTGVAFTCLALCTTTPASNTLTRTNGPAFTSMFGDITVVAAVHQISQVTDANTIVLTSAPAAGTNVAFSWTKPGIRELVVYGNTYHSTSPDTKNFLDLRSCAHAKVSVNRIRTAKVSGTVAVANCINMGVHEFFGNSYSGWSSLDGSSTQIYKSGNFNEDTKTHDSTTDLTVPGILRVGTGAAEVLKVDPATGIMLLGSDNLSGKLSIQDSGLVSRLDLYGVDGVVDAYSVDAIKAGGIILPQRMLVTSGIIDATYDQDRFIFTADRAYQVTRIELMQSAIEASSATTTLMLEKVPSGTAIGSGSDLLNAAVNLKTDVTANTKLAPALYGVASNLQLAAGDSIALDFTNAITEYVGVVTVTLKAI